MDMARERTKEEILDQAVYAVACVSYHYGPAFSEEGLLMVRALLSTLPWRCDSTWRVDVEEGEGLPDPDFCPKVIDGRDTGLNWAEVVAASRLPDLLITPIEQFAIALLNNDPLACDAVRDILKQ